MVFALIAGYFVCCENIGFGTVINQTVTVSEPQALDLRTSRSKRELHLWRDAWSSRTKNCRFHCGFQFTSGSVLGVFVFSERHIGGK